MALVCVGTLTVFCTAKACPVEEVSYHYDSGARGVSQPHPHVCARSLGTGCEDDMDVEPGTVGTVVFSIPWLSLESRD